MPVSQVILCARPALRVVVTLTLCLLGLVLTTRPATAADQIPGPLPLECGGVNPPGQPNPCCAYGYVYRDDAPVAGASVRVASPYGILNTVTAKGWVSDLPYYSIDLSSPPLSASVGTPLTFTVSLSGVSASRTWVTVLDGQQIDLGLPQYGNDWVSEAADDAGYEIVRSSLDLDADDRPHIAYQDYTNQDLKYASFDGKAWYTETVHSPNDTGNGPSLAVDSKGNPHVAWIYYAPAHSLMYGYRLSSTWHIETVSADSWPKEFNLVLDSQDRPHVAFFSDAAGTNNTGAFLYAWRDEAGWRIEPVGEPSPDGTFTSLALDSLDRPHVAYGQVADKTLKYAWYDGDWHIETVHSEHSIRGRVALDLDSSDHPHFIYQNSARSTLEYFWSDGNSWYSDTVGSATNGPLALELDSSDQPHVSYSFDDGAADYVKHAYRERGVWNVEAVASGEYASLALDTSGQPHISYANDASRALWYASIAVSPTEMLVFTRGSGSRTTDTEIYTIQPDGSDLTRLTHNDWVDWKPKISPDGRKMAFLAGDSAHPTATTALYTLDIESGEVATITDEIFGSYAWSPDSTRILYVFNDEIRIVDLETGSVDTVPTTLTGIAHYDWSPDGTQLAITADPWALYTMNINGSDLQLISSRDPRGPVWSPDGEKIAYEEFKGNLRVINSDGTNDTGLSTGMYEAFVPTWSPDGAQIAYTALLSSQLRIINADGNNDHIVLNAPDGWIDGADWGAVGGAPPAPAAAFTASPLTDTVPLDAQFTDQTTGDVTGWSWDLGDGHTSGARHPAHSYELTGTYTVTLTATGPSGSDVETKANYITVSPPITPTWAFLLYLDGDNNLHHWLQRAVDKLEAASANPHVVILVQFDGPKYGDTWRYKIQPGQDYSWYMGELAMDDPQTLSDFVLWAREAYPTKRTYLAVTDHGRGTSGLAWDETSGSEHLLTVAELRAALRDATLDGAAPLDVVHYDACLMALVENAYQIKDYAHYLVATQNLGWNVFAYDRYANLVTENTTAEALVTAIVDAYDDAVAGYPSTISAFDLRRAGLAAEAITELATALLDDLETNRHYVNSALTLTQRLDSRQHYVIDHTDEYLDLYHLAQMLQQNVPDVDVGDAAQEVLDAVAALVVAERHESGYYQSHPYWDLDNVHGASIYFPPGTDSWGYADYVGDVSFNFTADGTWDEFLEAYLGLASTPPPAKPDVPPVLNLPFALYLPIVLK